MMWECGRCGCGGIAADVPACPQCFTLKEEAMPKITSGGPSNAWEQGEQELPEAELPPPPPASAPKADHAAYASAALGVPEDEAAAMKKADLVDLTQAAAAPVQPAPAAPVAPPAAPAVPAAPAPAGSPSAPQPGM